MNTLISYKTIDDYIKVQPEVTQKSLEKLRQCIKEAAPDAVELINYNIPAFALKKDGKREEQIMMAGYRNHIGFYPHPSTMEHFADELKGYKQGKGSVQFPINAPLPKALIIKMVTYRLKLLSQ